MSVECDWALITAPVASPLSLDEAKKHAVIHQQDDNALINAYIDAARLAAEDYLGRGLLTQTWMLQLSDFADEIWLPMAAPLQNNPAASPSTAPIVQYYDSAGTLQTLATSVYLVDTVSEPGKIVRAPNQVWPTLQSDRVRPVVITYVCGWTTPELVPELIKLGIRLVVAAADADRLGSADALKAAEACWSAAGRVFWRPPRKCLS